MGGKVFSGSLRVAEVNAQGVAQGPYIAGTLNPVQCIVSTPAADTIDQISNLPESLGQLLSQGQRPKPSSIKISTNDVTDQRILAYTYNGLVGNYSQTAATVTAQPVTIGTLGDWYPLPHRSVTSFTLKDHADTTTYVSGVDYLLDPEGHMFQPLVGGAIAAAAVVHYGYTAPALTGSTVQIATVPSRLLRVYVRLVALTDSVPAFFLAPICKLSASGDKDFFGKDMLVAELSGAMLLPPAGTTAWTETQGASSIITTIDPA